MVKSKDPAKRHQANLRRKQRKREAEASQAAQAQARYCFSLCPPSINHIDNVLLDTSVGEKEIPNHTPYFPSYNTLTIHSNTSDAVAGPSRSAETDETVTQNVLTMVSRLEKATLSTGGLAAEDTVTKVSHVPLRLLDLVQERTTDQN